MSQKSRRSVQQSGLLHLQDRRELPRNSRWYVCVRAVPHKRAGRNVSSTSRFDRLTIGFLLWSLALTFTQFDPSESPEPDQASDQSVELVESSPDPPPRKRGTTRATATSRASKAASSSTTTRKAAATTASSTRARGRGKTPSGGTQTQLRSVLLYVSLFSPFQGGPKQIANMPSFSRAPRATGRKLVRDVPGRVQGLPRTCECAADHALRSIAATVTERSHWHDSQARPFCGYQSECSHSVQRIPPTRASRLGTRAPWRRLGTLVRATAGFSTVRNTPKRWQTGVAVLSSSVAVIALFGCALVAGCRSLGTDGLLPPCRSLMTDVRSTARAGDRQ